VFASKTSTFPSLFMSESIISYVLKLFFESAFSFHSIPFKTLIYNLVEPGELPTTISKYPSPLKSFTAKEKLEDFELL